VKIFFLFPFVLFVSFVVNFFMLFLFVLFVVMLSYNTKRRTVALGCEPKLTSNPTLIPVAFK